MTYRLHDSLGYHLSRAARVQERRLDDGLRRLGLTRIRWCVLLAVGNEGLAKPSEIAAFVGIDRTATSRALREMDAAGLLERRAGDGDRRTSAVSLTARGRELLALGTPLAQANNRVMEDRLGPGETEVLIRLLERLTSGEAALTSL